MPIIDLAPPCILCVKQDAVIELTGVHTA